MKLFNKILLALIFIFTALAPHLIFANGGDQRIVEGKYYINLSRSPFTPRAGDKVAMLVSFVDLKTNKLVADALVVKVRISKLGEAPKGNFIFVQDNMPVKGGVLELSYTFTGSGLHEIFFDFALASSPQEIYEAPDFLLDIQEAKTQEQEKFNKFSLLAGLLGIVFGFFFGWLWKRKFGV